MLNLAKSNFGQRIDSMQIPVLCLLHLLKSGKGSDEESTFCGSFTENIPVGTGRPEFAERNEAAEMEYGFRAAHRASGLPADLQTANLCKGAEQGCDRFRLLQRIGLLTRRGSFCEKRTKRSGIAGRRSSSMA